MKSWLANDATNTALWRIAIALLLVNLVLISWSLAHPPTHFVRAPIGDGQNPSLYRHVLVIPPCDDPTTPPDLMLADLCRSVWV